MPNSRRWPLLVIGIILVALVAGSIFLAGRRPAMKLQNPKSNESADTNSSLSVGNANTTLGAPPVPERYLPLVKTVGSAQTPAEVEKALAPLAADYGIAIEAGPKAATSYAHQYFAWSNPAESDMVNFRLYATWLIGEWSKYPTAWTAQTKVKKIVFVNRLLPKGSSIEVGGMPDLVGSALYINLSNVNFGYEYAAANIHHEYAHLIDYNFWGNAAQKAEWSRLNPPGHTYQSDTIGSNPSVKDTRLHPATGFVSGHALYNFQEDRAETYAFLFTTSSYRRLQQWLPGDEYLQKKVAYYKKLFVGKVPTMNDAYFTALHQ